MSALKIKNVYEWALSMLSYERPFQRIGTEIVIHSTVGNNRDSHNRNKNKFINKLNRFINNNYFNILNYNNNEIELHEYNGGFMIV